MSFMRTISFLTFFLPLLAQAGQPFDELLASASCEEFPARPNPQTREIQKSNVRGKRINYPLTCELSGGVVKCRNEPEAGSCLKEATFNYDFTTKKSRLTEFFSGCANPLPKDRYEYSCVVKEKSHSETAARSTIELNKAVCTGNESDVIFFLNMRDVKIDFVNTDGKSTLGCAFETGNERILRAVLSNQYVAFNPYLVDKKGVLPIESAKNEMMLVILNELVPDYDINRPGGFGVSVLGNGRMGSLEKQILSIWPEAKIVYAEATDDCYQLTGSTITKFLCFHKHIVIPSTIRGTTITTIGAWAFSSDELFPPQREKVILPDSVTTIGGHAFYNTGMIELVLPRNLTSIHERAFSKNRLRSVDLPSTITSIGRYAFAQNRFVEIALPEKLKSIEDGTFANSYIKKLSVPGDVERIGAEAFSDNWLEILSLPPALKTIGSYAFARNKLQSISIPNSVTEIASGAFFSNRLETATIGNSVTFIGRSAFQSFFSKGDSINRNLITEIIIPDSVTVIEAEAFDYNALRTVVLGKNVRKIGKSAFRYNQLKSVKIPASTEDLHVWAFDQNVELVRD